MYELQARKAAAKPAANAPQIDRNLPAHLPREDQVHRPEATASHHDASGQLCGCLPAAGACLIGQKVSEQLEYVPARFKVIRHVRPKLACVKCQTIFQAPAPSRPIAKGLAAAGLLAHVMVSKYCDGYRQSRVYTREAWKSTAPPWPAGSITVNSCWTRSLQPLAATCWPPGRCTPTTRR